MRLLRVPTNVRLRRAGLNRQLCAILISLALAILLADPALAAGSGMPWEGPLTKITDSLTGPVAKAVGVIAIVVSGLMLAFGEAGGMLRRVLQVVFGLAIAFAASSFFIGFFGFAGGAAL